MSDAAEKRTPLYDEHVRLGAKIIPFGGWLMPVQYSSIMEEHQAVRNKLGVFDISHMGELVATGSRAGEWLNTMLTNNIAKLEVGAGQYTLLLNDDAGIIDDLIVYRAPLATGSRAGEWLNTMLTNNIAKLEVGAGQYTLLLNDDAGIIDDLIVY